MEHACRASISTPVRSTVSTLASTAMLSSPISKLIETAPTSSGWHSGIISAVRLAAWIPATRATAKTSPLVTSRLATPMVVPGFMNPFPRPPPRRWVGSFGVTSTIRARPSGSRWVKVWSDTGRVYGAALRPARGNGPGPDGTPRPTARSAADLAHRAGRAHEGDGPDPVTGPLRADGPLDLGG